MSNIYLGLDVSLNHSGAVILYDNTCHANSFSNAEDLPMLQKMNNTADGIFNFAKEYIESGKKVIVCAETPLFRWRRSDNLIQLAGAYYVVVCQLASGFGSAFVQHCSISNTAAKKVATGSGKGTKEEMYAAIPAPIQLILDKCINGHRDVSDAYWCAVTAMEKLENGTNSNGRT